MRIAGKMGSMQSRASVDFGAIQEHFFEVLVTKFTPHRSHLRDTRKDCDFSNVKVFTRPPPFQVEKFGFFVTDSTFWRASVGPEAAFFLTENTRQFAEKWRDSY